MGFKAERIVRTDSFSLFSERSRISEMAVYIVHASLLLIFLGGIVDALYGWRGFVTLTPGTSSNQVELMKGAARTLPFSIRCDGTGEETYKDGTPKRWWSKLAVVQDGREVSRKEIVGQRSTGVSRSSFLSSKLRTHRKTRSFGSRRDSDEGMARRKKSRWR